jgi:hypothetical protein
MEVEQQKRKEAKEQIEREWQGAMESKRLIVGGAAGHGGRTACSLAQGMEWEIREQQGWQRPCNITPPSPC